MKPDSTPEGHDTPPFTTPPMPRHHNHKATTPPRKLLLPLNLKESRRSIGTSCECPSGGSPLGVATVAEILNLSMEDVAFPPRGDFDTVGPEQSGLQKENRQSGMNSAAAIPMAAGLCQLGSGLRRTQSSGTSAAAVSDTPSTSLPQRAAAVPYPWLMSVATSRRCRRPGPARGCLPGHDAGTAGAATWHSRTALTVRSAA